MKEALVQKDLSVKIVDSPIPTPEADQVIIKVAFSGSNPKDWKYGSGNAADDIAGTIHAIGSNIYQFREGDRVAAFHEMQTPGGSFAEYAVAYQHTTFPLPKHVGFPEAATLPLAAMTSAVGLYQRLGLPEPWSPARPKGKLPLLVYGAASAVGAFAIQFASLSGIHPIIGIAGRGIPFAESLLDKSKGDAVVDYRKGDAAVVDGVKDALKAAGCEDIPLQYCFDAVSENGSHKNIAKLLSTKGSHSTHVLPIEMFAPKGFKYPEGITGTFTMVGDAHNSAKDFASVWFHYFSRLLEDGRLKTHPYQEIPGGLAGISEGLKNLKEGRASAVKYVFDISKTEGVEGLEGAAGIKDKALAAAATAGFRVD